MAGLAPNGAHQQQEQDLSGNVSAATQQLLAKLDEDLPLLVPEELVMYHFRQAGCNADDDPQLVRLVALASQRFMAAVLNDAAALARRRAQAAAARSKKGLDPDRALVLRPEDAAGALREYGVNVRSAPYFVNPRNR